MKRCFAIVFLSVFLITYLLPVTTLVKADVVIGDNDTQLVNENAYILGRKIALMESIPNLLNSGATELTITNTDDLDSYLDSLWEEISDGVSYLTSGDWIGEVPIQFRNEALQNFDNYINYIDDRSNWFAELLRDPTTTLLKTYVIGNNLPKTEYKPYYNAKSVFGSLARLNSSEIPQPDPDFSYINNIQDFYYKSVSFMANNKEYMQVYTGQSPWPVLYYDFLKKNVTWFTDVDTFNHTANNTPSNYYTRLFPLTSILRVDFNSNDNTAYYTGATYRTTLGTLNGGTVNATSLQNIAYQWNGNYNVMGDTFYANNGWGSITPNWQTSFSGISTFINYIYAHFSNINVYVDGVPWALVDVSSNSTLDIDGYLKIYGNNNPVLYDIPDGTQIDYDALYDTIYNAILNALPIDQQDITYYDSHDTVYSPTIINNYGSDSEDEKDWIESILDYAIVPEFDTALVEPISEPITNGTLVMVTGVSVIPEDILFVLGAAFVLILFACIINRMIE